MAPWSEGLWGGARPLIKFRWKALHACAKGRRSPFSEEATLLIPVSPTAGRKVTVGYAAGLELTAAWKGITSSTECQMPGLICVCFYHPQKIATLQILPALSWAFKWSLNKYTNKSIDFTELKLREIKKLATSGTGVETQLCWTQKGAFPVPLASSAKWRGEFCAHEEDVGMENEQEEMRPISFWDEEVSWATSRLSQAVNTFAFLAPCSITWY